MHRGSTIRRQKEGQTLISKAGIGNNHMLRLTIGVAAETPGGEKCQRMKNRTRVTLKNLCIKTKAWNFKKHLLQGDMQTNINWKK